MKRVYQCLSVLTLSLILGCSPQTELSEKSNAQQADNPLIAESQQDISEQSRPKPRAGVPNIVLFFADDAGYADFGFHGSKTILTPHLDRLATQGMIFSQAYVSDPTCGPSRAGLLTGRYQQEFGFEENNVPGYMSPSSKFTGIDMGIPLDVKTMGDYLQDQGYVTAIYGKWHVGGADRFHPLNRGFDEFYGFRGGRRVYFARTDDLPPKGEEDSDLELMERGFENYEEPDIYLTDALGNEAADFIERNKDRPFFVMVSFNAPHSPMQATEEDLAQFPELEGNRKIYAAMMLSMDRASGHVLNTLDRLGLSDNTIVIFTNDNGGPSDQNASNNAPFAGTKSNHLEGGIRVPFVMRWPGKITPGARFDQPVSTLDLLPTFFAAAGGNSEALEGVDGHNLIPFVTGDRTSDHHESLYWKKDVRAAIRQGEWKLIRYPDRPAELFNLSEDIGEQSNLSEQYPDRTRQLFQDLYDWEKNLAQPIWQLDRKWEDYDIKRMDKYRTPAKAD